MAEPRPLRIPRIRRAPIPDDAVLVVRGDDLDPATSRAQALAFRRRYPDWGRFGLSAFYARNYAEIDDLAADQLERFPVLAVFHVADLTVAGFDVLPTFRSPHVTIGFGEPFEAHLEALIELRSELRQNSYHEAEPTTEEREEGPA